MHSKLVPAVVSRSRPLLAIVYLAAAGMGTVVATSMYLEVPFTPLMALICLGGTFGVYVLNQFTDMKEDFANDSYKSIFFSSRKHLMHLAWPLLGITVATLVLTANLNSYFLVLFGVGVIYSCRAIPWYDSTTGQMRFVRLKEIPFMKNISVAVLWGVSPFAVPILLAHANLQQPELMCVGILSATLVLSSLNSTVFCDVLDMEGDRFAGTRTLPIIIGAKPTIAALAALNAIWAAAIVLFGRHVVLDMPHTVLVLALAAFPTLYLLPFWNGWLKRSELKTLCELDLLVFTGGIVALSLL